MRFPARGCGICQIILEVAMGRRATMAILRQYRIPYASGPVEAELLTPTDAGIPAGMCVGAGLGQRNFGHAYPNALRLDLSSR